jgi:hypothetical protein
MKAGVGVSRTSGPRTREVGANGINIESTILAKLVPRFFLHLVHIPR